MKLPVELSNNCTHSGNPKLSPIWTTEGDIQFASIYCTKCDAFIGFLTRKTPKHEALSFVIENSTVKLHQLANLSLFLRRKTDKDNGELKA